MFGSDSEQSVTLVMEGNRRDCEDEDIYVVLYLEEPA
jgi:hypothetical protein